MVKDEKQIYLAEEHNTIEIDQIIHRQPLFVRLNGEKVVLPRGATLVIQGGKISEIDVDDEGIIIGLDSRYSCKFLNPYHYRCILEKE